MKRVTVGLAFGGFPDVKETLIPGRDLHASAAHLSCPRRDRIQGIEWRRIPRKLRQKDRWPLDYPNWGTSLIRF